MKYGKIIRGVGGFYYVRTSDSELYECRARGVFRNQDVKPLVGDDVGIDVVSEKEKTGSVSEILPRRNALVRPEVANVDQALVVFSLTAPKPNTNLLDKLLILMEQQEVPSVICMNKTDLVSSDEVDAFREIYRSSGYPLLFFSAKTGKGVDAVGERIAGKTSTLAGPSGSGKSTLINLLAPHAQMETGEISRKIKRGKNTTRHSELITVDEETYLVDTPGFSSLSADSFIPEGKQQREGGFLPVNTDTLSQFFPEFTCLEDACRFRGCSHLKEPGCAVRAAVENGEISRSRYTSYQQIYNELKENKKY